MRSTNVHLDIGVAIGNGWLSDGLRKWLTSLWQHLRCDVGLGGRGRVAELPLCIAVCIAALSYCTQREQF